MVGVDDSKDCTRTKINEGETVPKNECKIIFVYFQNVM